MAIRTRTELKTDVTNNISYDPAVPNEKIQPEHHREVLNNVIDSGIPVQQRGQSNGVATLDSTGKIPTSEIPSGIATDSEVATAVNNAVTALRNGVAAGRDTLKELSDAIDTKPSTADITRAVEALKGGAPADLDTLKELADAIGLRVHDRGTYDGTVAYLAHDLVQRTAGGGTAFYLATTAVAANSAAVTAPGTGTAWQSSWARLGWSDGAPGSHIGAPTLNNGVLSIGDRGGNTHQVTLPLLSEASERIERIDFNNLTAAQTDVELTPKGTPGIQVVLGSGDAEILSNIRGNDFTMAPGLYIIDLTLELTAGNNQNARNAVISYQLRQSSNNNVVLGGLFTTTRVSGSWTPVSTYAVVNITAATSVNLFVIRSAGNSNVNVRNLYAEVVRFGGPKGAKGDKGDPGGSSLTQVGSQNINVQQTNRWQAPATPIDISSIDDETVCAVQIIDNSVNKTLFWLLGSAIIDNATVSGAISAGAHFADIEGLRLYLGRTSGDELLFAASNNGVDPSPLTLWVMGETTGPAVSTQPSVSSFTATSGSLSPAAGSIANLVYGVAWAIAQSSHVEAARIVGFRGIAANPTSVSVLHTVTEANYAHGTASVTIPGGVSLSANQVYTLRLEVYRDNQDPATELPTAYQDLRITAHDAATANYHAGRIEYNASDDTVAKQSPGSRPLPAIQRPRILPPHA